MINPEYHHKMENFPGTSWTNPVRNCTLLNMETRVFAETRTLTMINITIHRTNNNRLMLVNIFTTQRTSFTITITTGFHHKTTCFITHSTLL